MNLFHQPSYKLLTAAGNKPQFLTWLISSFNHITRKRMQKMNMKKLFISYNLVNIQLVTSKILFKNFTHWSWSYTIYLINIFFFPVYFNILLSVKLSAVDLEIYSQFITQLRFQHQGSPSLRAEVLITDTPIEFPLLQN